MSKRLKISIIALLSSLWLPFAYASFDQIQDSAPSYNIDVSQIPDAKPMPLPFSATGNPPYYDVNGKRYYVLKTNLGYTAEGTASWYGTKFQGRRTSSGEPYDMFAMTAASPDLPIPSFVEVTNLENGKKVIVKVNDRGPFHDGRVMDLSYAAAKKLGVYDRGTAKVKIVAIETGKPITKGNYYLQIGSFQQSGNASQFAQQMASLVKHPIFVSPINRDDRILYRVLIGPILSLDQTEELKNLLNDQGQVRSLTLSKL